MTIDPNNYGVKLIESDCLPALKDMGSETIDLVVTSPPYIGAPRFWGAWFHSSNADVANQWLYSVWDECLRVLRPGCKLIVNVANTKRRPYVSNVHELYKWATRDSLSPRSKGWAERAALWRERDDILRRAGADGKVGDADFERLEKIHRALAGFQWWCEPLGEIIWDKGYGQGGTAWGSFRSPSDMSLADSHEYIVVFRKFGERARPDDFEKINTKDFKSWRNSVWKIQPAKAGEIGHIAPFPVAIPTRLITLYSFEGETVLDPFCGAGTTGVAAHRLKRAFIGIDHNADYIALARERIKREQMQLSFL